MNRVRFPFHQSLSANGQCWVPGILFLFGTKDDKSNVKIWPEVVILKIKPLLARIYPGIFLLINRVCLVCWITLCRLFPWIAPISNILIWTHKQMCTFFFFFAIFFSRKLPIESFPNQALNSEKFMQNADVPIYLNAPNLSPVSDAVVHTAKV